MNRKTQKKTDKKKEEEAEEYGEEEEEKNGRCENMQIEMFKKRRVKQVESNSVQFTRFVENERCEIVNRKNINNNCIHGDDATTVHREL